MIATAIVPVPRIIVHLLSFRVSLMTVFDCSPDPIPVVGDYTGSPAGLCLVPAPWEAKLVGA